MLAPAEGIAPLQAYLEASYFLPEFLGFPIRWLSLADCPQRGYTLPGDLTLNVYTNRHVAWYQTRIDKMNPPPARSFTFESYSGVFTRAGQRFLYAGNLQGAKGTDEMAPYAEPCDLLVTEIAHVDPVELGRFLANRDIKHTVITHFHPKWNGVPDEVILAKIHEGAGTGTIRGRISLARDGFALKHEVADRP